MPVTFGTVQLVPAPAPRPALAGGAAAPSASPAPDPRDLGPSLRHLHQRKNRVRAH